MPNKQFHDITVVREGRWPRYTYHAACSCGKRTLDASKKTTAEDDGQRHHRAELEMTRLRISLQRGTYQAPRRRLSPEDTVKEIVNFAADMTKNGQDRVAEARRTLEDETAALSPTEYEYWVARRAVAESYIEVGEELERILGVNK
jgi:hypothetical protein